jgi:hypothetical protein
MLADTAAAFVRAANKNKYWKLNQQDSNYPGSNRLALSYFQLFLEGQTFSVLPQAVLLQLKRTEQNFRIAGTGYKHRGH